MILNLQYCFVVIVQQRFVFEANMAEVELLVNFMN